MTGVCVYGAVGNGLDMRIRCYKGFMPLLMILMMGRDGPYAIQLSGPRG